MDLCLHRSETAQDQAQLGSLKLEHAHCTEAKEALEKRVEEELRRTGDLEAELEHVRSENARKSIALEAELEGLRSENATLRSRPSDEEIVSQHQASTGAEYLRFDEHRDALMESDEETHQLFFGALTELAPEVDHDKLEELMACSSGKIAAGKDSDKAYSLRDVPPTPRCGILSSDSSE